MDSGLFTFAPFKQGFISTEIKSGEAKAWIRRSAVLEQGAFVVSQPTRVVYYLVGLSGDFIAPLGKRKITLTIDDHAYNFKTDSPTDREEWIRGFKLHAVPPKRVVFLAPARADDDDDARDYGTMNSTLLRDDPHTDPFSLPPNQHHQNQKDRTQTQQKSSSSSKNQPPRSSSDRQQQQQQLQQQKQQQQKPSSKADGGKRPANEEEKRRKLALLPGKRQKEWRVGLSQFGDDVCTGCLSLICPCYVAAYTRHAIAGGSVFMHWANLLICSPFCVSCFMLCRWRGELRRRFNIEGTPGNDCLLSYFCPCCVTMQEAREVYYQNPGRPGRYGR